MDFYDLLLAKKLNGGGGGGEAVLINKNISANGTYNASSDSADGYKKVVVSVPNTYSAGDEGKVVSSGALVSQSSATYTSNNTYDTTLINSVTVNLPQGWTTEGILNGTEPNGALVIPSDYKWDSLRKVSAYRYAPITSISYGGTNTTQYNGGLNAPFQYCTATSVSCPNLTKIGWSMFNHLEMCTSFYFPNVTSIDRGGLSESYSVENFVFPCLDKIDLYAFSSSAVEKFDMRGNTSIEANGLNGCTNLNVLVIRNNGVQQLKNINAFGGTPFASNGTGGTLYVPSAQISSYQSASNWSTILGYANNQIKSIESTHTDPNAPIDLTLYYVDGTVIGA